MEILHSTNKSSSPDFIPRVRPQNSAPKFGPKIWPKKFGSRIRPQNLALEFGARIRPQNSAQFWVQVLVSRLTTWFKAKMPGLSWKMNATKNLSKSSPPSSPPLLLNTWSVELKLSVLKNLTWYQNMRRISVTQLGCPYLQLHTSWFAVFDKKSFELKQFWSF